MAQEHQLLKLTNNRKTCSHSPQSVEKVHNIKTLAQNQFVVNQLLNKKFSFGIIMKH